MPRRTACAEQTARHRKAGNACHYRADGQDKPVSVGDKSIGKQGAEHEVLLPVKPSVNYDRHQHRNEHLKDDLKAAEKSRGGSPSAVSPQAPPNVAQRAMFILIFNDPHLLSAGTGRNLNKKTEIKRVDGIISYCSEKCKRRKPDLADGDRKMLICSITKSNIDSNLHQTSSRNRHLNQSIPKNPQKQQIFSHGVLRKRKLYAIIIAGVYSPADTGGHSRCGNV